MIESFKDKLTEKIWNGEKTNTNAVLQRQALKRLRYLHAAININDLRIPPSNRLELLRGNRQRQYSIRVNIQYRLCFKWINNKAVNVEFTDYH